MTSDVVPPIDDFQTSPICRFGIHDYGRNMGIKFPYNPEMVRQLKRTPGTTWNPLMGAWVVPWVRTADIRSLLKRIGAPQQHWVWERLEQADRDSELMRLLSVAGAELPPSLAAKIPVWDPRLRAYQNAGVEYLVRAQRSFLADEMGLGKTLQALVATLGRGLTPLIVVCPAILKETWRGETLKWYPGTRVEVISGLTPRRLEPADVYVLNYDIIHKWVRYLPTARSLILDEAHAMKNRNAQRTRAVLEYTNRRLSERAVVYALTGTPILNRPADLIPVLRALERIQDMGGTRHFLHRYCLKGWTRWGKDFSGANNLEELQYLLRSTCLVRRLKDDVLSELPEKTYAEVLFRGHRDWMREYKSTKDDVASWIRRNMAKAENDEERKHVKAKALVKLTALRHILGMAKVGEAADWIKNAIEAGPVVVFAHHHDVLDGIRERLGSLNPPILDGRTPTAARDVAIRQFQEGRVSVLLCSIRAAGVGLTLTRASQVLFVEMDWVPAINRQAEDRVHRLGQRQAVTVWRVVIPDTLDERILAVNRQKEAVFRDLLESEVTDQLLLQVQQYGL